jgi:hypothetical protein
MGTSPSNWGTAGPSNSFQWGQVTGGGPAAGQQFAPPSSNPILDGCVVSLTNAPTQVLTVALPINGTTITLNLVVSFNEIGQFWVMSVFDQSYNALFSDVPLITGYWPGGNILAQYDYAGIGGATVIAQNGGVGDWPGINGWGNGWILCWYSNAEYLSASGGVQ